jgi:hypothetical protein
MIEVLALQSRHGITASGMCLCRGMKLAVLVPIEADSTGFDLGLETTQVWAPYQTKASPSCLMKSNSADRVAFSAIL